jgi:hypothetical protein
LVDGKQEGTGLRSWEDGDFYTGEFKNGSRHGKGIYIWPGGNVYEGEWENGKMNGIGVLFHIREKNEGQFKDGKYQGIEPKEEPKEEDPKTPDWQKEKSNFL